MFAGGGNHPKLGEAGVGIDPQPTVRQEGDNWRHTASGNTMKSNKKDMEVDLRAQWCLISLEEGMELAREFRTFSLL